MKSVRTLAVTGLLTLGVIGGIGQAHAQTVLANGITVNTLYTYGDTTFDFTACSSCSNLELVGVFNGRSGTEIEVEEKTSIQSYIFNNSSNNQSLAFTLTVGTKTGNNGISSITNIANGTDGGSSGNDSKVTSVLSNITGTGTVTTGPATLTSQIGSTPAIAASWNKQTASFTFTDTLTEAKCVPCSTLQLTNVRLLLNPAPEPASLAIVASGLMGLATVRRRLARRGQQS